MLSVTVVIPAHNAQRDLPHCLRAIRAARLIVPEIIVVDDASTDETVAIAMACGVTRILRMPRCSGPAAARNAGAAIAAGDVLFFVDSDVIVHQEALVQAVGYLQDGTCSAVFGSYDTRPVASGLVSQYRNLLHHFVHQTSKPEAQTFWAGCGAIRRDVFRDLQGFSTDFPVPSVEDIEFGMRLARNGHRILLAREIRASHTKRWTLYSTIFTDIFRRGIPWTRLLLANGPMPGDLNICISQRLSVGLLGFAEAAFLLNSLFHPILLLLIPALLFTVFLVDLRTTHFKQSRTLRLAAISIAVLSGLTFGNFPVVSATVGVPVGLLLLLNQRLIRFFGRVRGVSFAICCLPLLMIYYNCCGVSFLAGTVLHLRGRKASGGTVRSIRNQTSTLCAAAVSIKTCPENPAEAEAHTVNSSQAPLLFSDSSFRLPDSD